MPNKLTTLQLAKATQIVLAQFDALDENVYRRDGELRVSDGIRFTLEVETLVNRLQKEVLTK